MNDTAISSSTADPSGHGTKSILGVAAVGLLSTIVIAAAGLLIVAAATAAFILVRRRASNVLRPTAPSEVPVELGQGLAPTGRRMSTDEVYFFRTTNDRIRGLWGLEDTWTRMRQLAGDARLGELGSLG